MLKLQYRFRKGVILFDLKFMKMIRNNSCARTITPFPWQYFI